MGQQKLLALIDEAEQAKKKLLELIGKPATSPNNQLVHCTKAQLATLKASELKALYHVRNFDTASLPAGFGGRLRCPLWDHSLHRGSKENKRPVCGPRQPRSIKVGMGWRWGRASRPLGGAEALGKRRSPFLCFCL